MGLCKKKFRKFSTLKFNSFCLLKASFFEAQLKHVTLRNFFYELTVT